MGKLFQNFTYYQNPFVEPSIAVLEDDSTRHWETLISLIERAEIFVDLEPWADE
jgi:hypothetical protein